MYYMKKLVLDYSSKLLIPININNTTTNTNTNNNNNK